MAAIDLLSLFDAYKAAVANKDLAGLMSIYDDSIYAFDAWNVWLIESFEAWRGMNEQWFASLGQDHDVVEFAERQNRRKRRHRLRDSDRDFQRCVRGRRSAAIPAKPADLDRAAKGGGLADCPPAYVHADRPQCEGDPQSLELAERREGAL